jgi:hypothetical protein
MWTAPPPAPAARFFSKVVSAISKVTAPAPSLVYTAPPLVSAEHRSNTELRTTAVPELMLMAPPLIARQPVNQLAFTYVTDDIRLDRVHW